MWYTRGSWQSSPISDDFTETTKAMHLLLIRHATNDWVGSRLAGWTPGVHLNEKGHAEAEALAARLDGYPIDAIYSSPLERALETAEYLAQPRDLSVVMNEELGEVRYGDWTGRTLEELREDDVWRRAHFYPSGTTFPGGESLAQVSARVVAAIDELCARHDGEVVAVVAHGDVIRVAIAHYAGIHQDLFRRVMISTASLSIIRFTQHGPQLLLMNDCGTPQPPPKPEPGSSSSQDG